MAFKMSQNDHYVVHYYIRLAIRYNNRDWIGWWLTYSLRHWQRTRIWPNWNGRTVTKWTRRVHRVTNQTGLCIASFKVVKCSPDLTWLFRPTDNSMWLFLSIDWTSWVVCKWIGSQCTTACRLPFADLVPDHSAAIYGSELEMANHANIVGLNSPIALLMSLHQLAVIIKTKVLFNCQKGDKNKQKMSRFTRWNNRREP